MMYIEPTESQKRIWVTQMMYPNSALFHIGGIFRTSGQVDQSSLRAAVLYALMKTQLPFIRLDQSGGKLVQYCSREMPMILEKDYKGLDFEKIITEDFRQKMELLHAPLYKIILFRADAGIGFYVKLHHIIADGYSMQLFAKLIANKYNDMLNTVQTTMERPSISQFETALKNEQAYLKSSLFYKDRQYWMDLHQNVEVQEQNAQLTDIQAVRQQIPLSHNTVQAIRAFSKENKVSILSVYILAYLIAHSDLNGDQVKKLGIPVLGRSGAKERNLFGMMTNLLLLPFDLTVEQSILQTLMDIDGQIKRAYRHSKYPYNYLVRNLSALDMPFVPYHTCINYYAGSYPAYLGESQIQIQELFSGESHYDLQLLIDDLGEEMKVYFDYNTSCFTDHEINQLSGDLVRTVEYILTNQLDILSSAKRHLTPEVQKRTPLSIKKMPPADSIVQRLLWYSKKYPDRVAIMYDEGEKTYRELSEMVISLSCALRKRSDRKSDMIAVYFDNYFKAVISILAIIHAGHTFLPIDRNWPVNRIQFIMQEARPNSVLSDKQKDDAIITQADWIIYDPLKDNVDSISEMCDLGMAQCSTMAYLMYTSGSTGHPKGVMVTHANLMNYLGFAAEQYDTTSDIVMPLFTSLAFDLTLTSLFLPLYTGGAIKTYQHSDKLKLEKIIQDGCTVIKLTPMHLKILGSADIKTTALEKIVVGGEDLKVSLARGIYEKFGGNISIYNEYGPTEATIGCMFYQYNPELDLVGSVPIGTAINNVEIHLLDRHLKPVAQGEVGEIYISGASVSLGYFKNTRATAKHFISNASTNHQTWYKTNDYARYVRKECMMFLGRQDNQINVNGFRVELGEIEAVCNDMTGIDYSVAVCTAFDGNQSVILYYTSNHSVSEQEVSAYLHTYLPYYMIPSLLIRLSDFPLTENRKADRKLLSSSDFIQEHFVTEKKEQVICILVEQVKSILGKEGVSVRSNWYALGGDSIKAIELSSAMLSYGFILDIKTILTTPIIEDMAASIKPMDKRMETQKLEYEENDEGPFPFPPVFQWFFKQRFKKPSEYAHSICLKLKNRIDRNTLMKMQEALLSHHKALSVKILNNKWCYASTICHDAVEEVFYTEQSTSQEILSASMQDRVRLDISSGLTFRMRLLHFQDMDILCITAHHIVIDGYSWILILRDLDELLQQTIRPSMRTIPVGCIPYHRYALDITEKQISEKARELYAATKRIPLPVLLKNDNISDTKNILIELSPEYYKSLTELQQKLELKVDAMYITVFLRTIKDIYHCSSAVLELELNDRLYGEREDAYSRTVGWFTNMLPICFHEISDSFTELYAYVKDQLNHYKQVAWELSLLSQQTPKEDHAPVFTLNILNHQPTFTSFEIFAEVQQHMEASDRIEVDLYLQNDRLLIHFRYDANLYKEKNISGFTQTFLQNLKETTDLLKKQSLGLKAVERFADAQISLQDISKIFDDNG